MSRRRPDWLWIAVIVAIVIMLGVGILMSALPVQRPNVPELVRKPTVSTQMDDRWRGWDRADGILQGKLPMSIQEHIRGLGPRADA